MLKALALQACECGRSDLSQSIGMFTQAGFVYRHAADIDMFLDGPQANVTNAVQVVFAGEKVRDDCTTTEHRRTVSCGMGWLIVIDYETCKHLPNE